VLLLGLVELLRLLGRGERRLLLLSGVALLRVSRLLLLEMRAATVVRVHRRGRAVGRLEVAALHGDENKGGGRQSV
jgi:hypothetical protein